MRWRARITEEILGNSRRNRHGMPGNHQEEPASNAGTMNKVRRKEKIWKRSCIVVSVRGVSMTAIM